MAIPVPADPLDLLLPHLVDLADLEKLAPYLKDQGLLTNEECRELMEWSRVLPKWQAGDRLIKILKKVGPKALALFKEAVRVSAGEGGHHEQLLSRLERGVEVDVLSPFVNFSWKQHPHVPKELGNPNAVFLRGKLYVRSDRLAIIYSYDFTTTLWSDLPKPPVQRYAMAAYNDQLVLIGGRKRQSGEFSDVITVWNDEKQEWYHPLPPMPTAREGATAIGCGQYLIVAGGSNMEGVTSVVEVFDGKSNKWMTAQSLPKKCALVQSASDGTNWYIMSGCSVFYTSFQSLLNSASHQHQPSQTTMWKFLPDVPYLSAGVAVFWNHLIVIGGEDSGRIKNSIYAFSHTSQTWILVGYTPVPIERSTAVVGPSYKLLVIGGYKYGHTSDWKQRGLDFIEATLTYFPDSRITMKAFQHLEKAGGIKLNEELSSIWLEVAVFFQMDMSEIERILSEDPIACSRAMIEKWMKSTTMQPATWKNLLEALRASNREDLAKGIEKCSSLENVETTDVKTTPAEDQEALRLKYEESLAQKNEEIAEYERTIKAYTDTMAVRSHEHMKALTAKDLEIGSLLVQIQELQAQQQAPRPVQSHGEPSQDLSHTGHFRGAEIIGETCCHISGEKPLTYEWKGYGIRIQIPKGALPPDVTSAELRIKASLAGHYEFPEDHELVSGIFWISFPHQFLWSAILDIQHSLALTHPSQCSSLSFVVAKCTQKGLPYRFKLLEGGVFTPHSSYGSISISQFSGLGIARKRKRVHNDTQPATKSVKTDRGDTHVSSHDLSAEKQYSAQLYYLPKGINKWLLHFLIIQDLDICNTAIRQIYTTVNAEPGPYQRVFFESDEITLDISEDGAVSDGWSLFPLMHPGLTREIVDTYKPGQQIPSCQIQLKWTRREEEPEELLLRVQLIGAKKPYNYFSIARDPICEGPGSPSSPVSREVKSTPTTPIKKPDIEHLEPEFSDLMNEVAAKKPNKWRDIGIQLGLTPNELSAFSLTCFGNPNPCFTAIFTAWKDRRTRPYTWATIIEVLQSPAVGELRLAEDLKLKVTRTIG